MQAGYVIVGAGSAGCVLANRLTEDPRGRRARLEAADPSGTGMPTSSPSLVVVAEKLPGPSVQIDDELLDHARQNGWTVYHASRSCMMGNHAMSVVDSELRVHGLEALRVIGARSCRRSARPNTNAPTLMVAEKRAAMIKASARQRLAA